MTAERKEMVVEVPASDLRECIRALRYRALWEAESAKQMELPIMCNSRELADKLEGLLP